MAIENLPKSGWMRLQVLQNPEITFEELKKLYKDSGYPTKMKPKSKQEMYQARNQVRKHWGVSDLTEMPRKPNGELSTRGLLGLFFQIKGTDASIEDARKFFAFDGLEFTPASFASAKAHFGSPDPNQDNGPRAGKPRKTRKRRKRRKTESLRDTIQVSDPNTEKSAVYEDLELQLDRMIAKCDSVGDKATIARLRAARRQVSAQLVKLET